MITVFKRNRTYRFLAILFLLFLIVSETPLDTIGYVLSPFSRLVLVVIIFLLMIGYLFISGNIVIDKIITIWLAARIVYFPLVSIMDLSNRHSFLSHFLIICIGPIVFLTVYSISRQGHKDTLINLLKLSVIIIAIQTVFSLFSLLLSGHGIYQIKLSIGIPIGYSNTIASIALIQSMLCYLLINNKLYFSISALTLLCTLSKAAFLIFFLLIFATILIDSFKQKKATVLLKSFTLIVLTLFIANYFFYEYFSVYRRAIDAFMNNDIESINNGRISIFEGYLNDILQKPILGWGIGKYNSIDGMAHNWLLQSLFSGGGIGTIIYYAPIVVILKRSLNWKDTKLRFILIMFLVSSFVHGSVENVYFTIPCEFIIWVYLTLLYKEGCQYE